jgi:hypothetical protein
MSVRDRSTDLRRIVCGVAEQALRDAAATGIVVLDDWTPEGELLYEWLVAGLGEERIWREASLASNVHGVDGPGNQPGAWRIAVERSALLAHPATKTALLLGGRLPFADLFPLGDLYATQVVALARGWTVPVAAAGLVNEAGAEAVDEALHRMIEGREPAAAACSGLDEGAATELIRLYARGRHYRLRPRLVPKLTGRTLGMDLFD